MRPLHERTIDKARREASLQLDSSRRAELGQFMTPTAIADFMVSLFPEIPINIRLLDPGAGVGSLSEAFAARFLEESPEGSTLDIEAYEIDPVLLRYLGDHLDGISREAKQRNRTVRHTIRDRDFIAEATFALGFGQPRFTHVILNPPYKKIGANSEHRALLRNLGIETVNLYAAFLALAVVHVEDRGEVVAIVPRSFCNGAYYRPFRQWLLKRTVLQHIHVFGSRTHAFAEDEVLQENVIVHLRRGGIQGPVTVSFSQDATFTDYNERQVAFGEVVAPEDSECFIRIPIRSGTVRSELFLHRLDDLGLAVATGPVVDFRVKEFWLERPEGECAPLLYAHHFKGGTFAWPKTHKKPNALRLTDETRKWLLPRGCYTLTKRFSAKEERRRLVAYVIDPDTLPFDFYGFENHLNVFHASKRGIDPALARGLALFLNSTSADIQFRAFSGHTQVNATDLRSMLYPSLGTLMEFGRWAQEHGSATQEAIDAHVEGKHAE
jgi:predicted RNA methylase